MKKGNPNQKRICRSNWQYNIECSQCEREEMNKKEREKRSLNNHLFNINAKKETKQFLTKK
jgi:hypothetical protein